jgi:glycosyltransferase involved in cell wall biosynthesis
VPRICIFPQAVNTGGVRSFQARLAAGLAEVGVQTCFDLVAGSLDAVLLTRTTRRLGTLRRLRRQGVRIVQRLDGINWLHRRLRTGLRHFLRAEYGNRLLALIRRSIATAIVYQSDFARGWWEWQYGPVQIPTHVIHNGVDLALFTPSGDHDRPREAFRLLLVEGSLQGGYETGLHSALGLAEKLAGTFPVELVVAGSVAEATRSVLAEKRKFLVRWEGLLPGERIPFLDRSAHLLYSADINAACPNSAIEAMACGLPVLGFATGALPELVTGDAGRVVPYGTNPWKLEPPDLPALASAAAEMLGDNDRFRQAARRRAEDALGLDAMVQHYLDVLL